MCFTHGAMITHPFCTYCNEAADEYMQKNQKSIYIFVLTISLSFSHISGKTTVKLFRSRMMPKTQHNLVTSAWGPANSRSGVDRNLPWPVFANPLAFAFLWILEPATFVATNVHQKSPKINLAEYLCKVKLRLVMRRNCTGKKILNVKHTRLGNILCIQPEQLEFQVSIYSWPTACKQATDQELFIEIIWWITPNKFQ